MLVLVLMACSKAPADDDISILVSTLVDNLDAPIDAAASPDGSRFFYLQGDDLFLYHDGGPQHLETVSSPKGLAVNPDGSRVYVADSTGIVAVAADGSVATNVMTGTEGLVASGLEASGDPAFLYMTLNDPGNEGVGLFRSPVDGGDREPVAVGDPFVMPDQVVVASDGTAYVTDLQSGGTGAVVKVQGGVATELVGGLVLGFPAGVALTLDESRLFVSTLDATGHSQITIVKLADGTTSTYAGTIGQSTGSGGLHRAADVDTFAWCGTGSGHSGAVYRIEL